MQVAGRSGKEGAGPVWEDNMDCPGTYTFYTGESTESTALNPSGKFRFFGLVRQNSDKNDFPTIPTKKEKARNTKYSRPF